MMVAAWCAALLGLGPWVWVGTTQRREAAFWWLAAAFAISFVADMGALGFRLPWVASAVYPVSQAALICAVFIPRRDAFLVLGALVCVGLASLPFTHANRPEVLLHTTAALAVCWIVGPLPALGMLRTALLIYFGLGLLAWYGYVWQPSGASWVIYQACRLVGILAFCRATLKPQPILRLA